MTCEVDCFPFCDESMFPKISISTDINDELNQNRVNIFPNPTNGELNIAFDLQEDINLKFIVTDLNGKILYENALSNNLKITEMKVNLKFLRNGSYLYKIISNDDKEIIHSGKISVVR